MATVAQLPNGQYIMTYEYGGDPDFAVYYRIGPDPTALTSVPDTPLISSDGIALKSSPYVTWSSYGGTNGTLILNSYSNGQIFVNQNLGAAGSWETIETAQPQAYSRSLLVLPDAERVLICGGGMLPPEPESFGSTARNSIGNRVSAGVLDLSVSLL